MAQYRVVLTDKVFPETRIEEAILKDVGATLEIPEGDRNAVIDQARHADALLNTYMPLDRDAIMGLTRCKIIARYGIGVDNIDLAAAREAGILVTNVPDYCVEEVATHSLAMMLALIRRIPEGDRAVRAGEWGVQTVSPIRRMSELTVGVIGLGRIGKKVADAVRHLGAQVLAYDPIVGPTSGVGLVELPALLSRSDVVTLHCPLTPGTRGLIGREQFEAMRAQAVLVNTSRGGLVVQRDLINALREGQIAGAALDVFEEEPPNPHELASTPGLILTPHVAFYSDAAIAESQRKAATQVARALTGRSPEYIQS